MSTYKQVAIDLTSHPIPDGKGCDASVACECCMSAVLKTVVKSRVFWVEIDLVLLCIVHSLCKGSCPFQMSLALWCAVMSSLAADRSRKDTPMPGCTTPPGFVWYSNPNVQAQDGLGNSNGDVGGLTLKGVKC
eukprot:2511302-Amphidinium_carterae.2